MTWEDLDLSGYTEKETKVLHAVFDIPLGKALTYGEVAKKAGLSKAARFVGSVMRKNRLAPIIPCHRVVRKDGIGAYAGSYEQGTARKKQLLEEEGAL